MVALNRHLISLSSSLWGTQLRSQPLHFYHHRFPATTLISRAHPSNTRRCGGARLDSSNNNYLVMSEFGTCFEVAQFLCLSDNYGYLIHDPKTKQTAAVDTPCAKSYKRELDKRGWTLSHILNTHKHFDHVGGNEELKASGVKVYGPSNDGPIPALDIKLSGGDTFSFAGAEVQVIDVGGHTVGHIAFYFPQQKTVFVGDSLFALGCGKMFEGTPNQFWASLKRLRNLPDDTVVYCAHEYTEGNACFAITVEPGNPDLVKRVKDVKLKRCRGEPTVPSLIGDEKRTNPFLRGDISEEIRKNVGATEKDSGAEIFRKIRNGKDTFRG